MNSLDGKPTSEPEVATMSHFFAGGAAAFYTLWNAATPARCGTQMIATFRGRSYNSGTIANALFASGFVDPKTGDPYSEALIMGASGGIAFGYFVFEYKGTLPHVALLTRNTFGPFERALDNLAIRREVRETTHADKAEANLRRELDCGNVAIVLADAYSMPYSGLAGQMMWAMQPVLVVGQDGPDFLIVDGTERAMPISAEDLGRARGKVKKDRYQMLVLQAPDADRVPEGLVNGIKTCTALFLDKPPAGSPNNFGIAGMRHFAKMLTDKGNAKGWAKTFPPGPRLRQALAGSFGQPGVWDWIEGWTIAGGADRGTYAAFLREAAAWTSKPDLAGLAPAFERSAQLWKELAEAAMPDDVPEFKALKELKRRHAASRFAACLEEQQARAEMREQIKALNEAFDQPGKLDPLAEGIEARMSEILTQIAAAEEGAAQELRAIVG